MNVIVDEIKSDLLDYTSDYICVDSKLMKFRIDFMFYIENNKAEDFYINEINVIYAI